MRRYRTLLPAAGIVLLLLLVVSCTEFIAELFVPIKGTWYFTGTITVESETFAIDATFDLQRAGGKGVSGKITRAAIDASPYPGTLPATFAGTLHER